MRLRRDDRPAARRRKHEHVPELARGGSGRGRMQRELAAADVPARIGIHVGEVIVEPERLTGDAVNIAARIESFAVPGGVMLSDAAYEQIQNRSDVERRSSGTVQAEERRPSGGALRGGGRRCGRAGSTERWRERASDSRASRATCPTRARLGRPGETTSASLVDLVRNHRVVTITGPGGVGKTRMSIELGRRLASGFLDGVAFVAARRRHRAGGLPPGSRGSARRQGAEGRTLGEGIVALIGERSALLLLDNFEQIVAAAPDVAGLVDRCPELRVVTTSRTPLRIAAEREYPLAPLRHGASPVALFRRACCGDERTFELTAGNTEAVAAICRRLDGLPLAIELAAARLRLLSPDALLDRLDRALDVLTSGPRDVPHGSRRCARRSTGATLSSTEPEQRLFRRMAVFAGGCTVADVEAVCADPGETVLDELESLLDKALVQVDGGRPAPDAADDRRVRPRAARRAGERRRRSPAGTPTGTRRSPARSGTVSRAPTRSPLSNAASPRRATSRRRSKRSLAAPRRATPRRARRACRCAGDLWMYWHIRGKNLSARE